MKRIALALVLVALPAAAWADGDYRWELTPHISYHGNSSFHSKLDGYDLRIDEGGALGVMFDIPLSNNLQVEVLLNAQASDLFSQSQLITGPDVKLANIDVTYAHIGLLAQFGRREVTPYVVVSAGLTRLDPDFEDVGVDDRFSASLGAGVKLFILPFLGLRLEGRAFWTDIDGFGDDTTSYRGYLSQGQVTAGVIFAW